MRREALHHGTGNSNRFSPGEIVAGKYRVAGTLGRGRGVLLQADHVSFEQKVAIRIVSPGAADRDSIVKFRREAATLAKLGSEHVARIIDVGTLEDGSLYLVRQYLDGADLATHLRSSGKLPVDVALSYILQATEAVAETHAYGILIRELTPERLFLANRSPGVRGGRPILKITDFGTAKLLDEAAPVQGENTGTAVLGLSPYSSPEALRRQRDIDVRTDVWSLAAILYEMLGGRPPFGVDVVSLAVAITRDEPVDLSQLNPSVPPELAAAVRLSLAKDKHERTADTHAFAASIARFAPPEGKVLMERIHDLASSARIKMGQAADEELEVSQFEEIDDAPTGQAEHEQQTRARESTANTAATKLAPLGNEHTEALGFSFVPSDPLSGNLSSRPPAGAPTFGRPPPSSHPPAEATQMLGWNAPVDNTTRMVAEQQMAVPAAALLSQSLRNESWRAADLPGPMTFGPPQDDASFGRKLAMYAFGGAIAAIVILSLFLATLYLFGR